MTSSAGSEVARLSRSNRPSIAIIGAGVCGMAAAIRLGELGHRVAVFDSTGHSGGLAGGFAVGGGSLERFYHHLFRSDIVAQQWIQELGLGARLEWLRADMGFYSGSHLYRFGTPLSLLTFGPLSLVDRIRLGLRIRSLSATSVPDEFEELLAIDWLGERASEAELRVFWRPLLTAKFGSDLDQVSMAWLWARFRARVGGAVGRAERLGYLRGGFQQLGDALARRAADLGVELNLDSPVKGVVVERGEVTGLRIAGRSTVGTDCVVWTPSLNLLARLVDGLEPAYREKCAAVRYHTAVVVVVELSESVLPYYWTTVGDGALPFTVAVEHTRLVGTGDYGNRTIVYLGRYVAPEDDLFRELDDDALGRWFLESAAQAFHPAFRTPLAIHVFRAPSAQPIVPPGWSAGRPALRTGVRGLVAANMAQIYPWDRGINYSIELGEAAAAAVLAELAQERTAITDIRS